MNPQPPPSGAVGRQEAPNPPSPAPDATPPNLSPQNDTQRHAPAKAARCDLTDLLADQCSCPNHRGDPDGHADTPPPGAFPASYGGRCPDCDEPIHPGDWIRYDLDGGYIHQECQ